MNINDYYTGNIIGHAEISDEAIARYNELAQQPQGIIEAGEVLSAEDLGRLGISGDLVIWLD